MERQKNRTTRAEANPEVGGTFYYCIPTSVMIDGTNCLLIIRSLFHSDQLSITRTLLYSHHFITRLFGLFFYQLLMTSH